MARGHLPRGEEGEGIGQPRSPAGARKIQKIPTRGDNGPKRKKKGEARRLQKLRRDLLARRCWWRASSSKQSHCCSLAGRPTTAFVGVQGPSWTASRPIQGLTLVLLAASAPLLEVLLQCVREWRGGMSAYLG